ncbi:Oidioi.mRNA.OKI2018_I69.PAR.g9965.t1.cds [Oikopleura dioica]|uniref:Oidioi.mRNA.OKI2018_I69.PAR.g9965.t1.cds n=1 Tax=Oikopleura dioica TaxID=34765 RepID=A0ABN7RRR9_OIKDI|nr:Oidioi.mRNA.OKI2018_I69.PAR.g9965.t1.cds [Oikopleura dioica]
MGKRSVNRVIEEEIETEANPMEQQKIQCLDCECFGVLRRKGSECVADDVITNNFNLTDVKFFFANINNINLMDGNIDNANIDFVNIENVNFA